MMNGENVPQQKSNVPGGKIKPWEHVWSIDEMRKDAPNWRLASDVGMLLHLQDFSQRMLARTHDIQEQIDAAVHEAKLTSVRVNNVFNDFITLANTQFVENRVYDEDVSGSTEKEKDNTIEKKELSKEERETELISRIKEAVGLGLSVLDSDYDRIDINVENSDSEDESPAVKSANVIFESKDPYIHRPLPYLIGSEEFERNDDVGLSSAIPDEEEVQSEPTPPAVTESTPTSSVPVMASTSASVPVASRSGPAFHHDDSSSDDSDDLFGDTSSSRPPQKKDSTGSNQLQQNNMTSSNATEPQDFNSDLAARLSARLAAPAESNGNENKEVKQQQPKTKRNSADLFALPIGNGDDDDDDDGDIFRRPSGLFSAPSQRSKLFDADNEEGGLFGTVPSQSANLPAGSKVADKTEPSVSASTSSTITSRPGAQNVTVTTQSTVKSGIVAPKGLFDDDEDDLFSVPSSKSATGAMISEQKKDAKPVVDLFAADDDEDEGDIFKTVAKPSATKPKLPAGAVAIFSIGGDEQFKAAVAKSRTSQGDTDQVTDDGDDKFKPSAVKSLLQQSNALRGGSASPSTQSSSSLFADDPELFVSTTKTNTSSPLPTRVASSKPKLNLFDDEEDDLFSSMAKTVPSKGSVAPSGKEKVAKLIVQDDDDLFASTTKTEDNSTKSTIPAVQPPKVTTSLPAGNIPVKSAPGKKAMSLFDDDNDNDEHGDLFGTTIPPKQSDKKVVPPSTQSKSGTLGLFGDDMLFSSNNDNPAVDLFGSDPSSPLATPKKSSDNSAASVTKQSSSSSVTKIPSPESSLREPSVTKIPPPESSLREPSVHEVVQSKTDEKGISDRKPKNDAIKPAAGGTKSTTSKVVDMFADESEEEDLFSLSNKPTKSVGEASSSVVKSSLLVAPPDDLFDVKTVTFSGESGKHTTTDAKKQDSLTTSDVRKTAPLVAARPSDKHDVHQDDAKSRAAKTNGLFGTAVPGGPPVAEPSGKIAQLQSNLAINPAALLPTSKRPITTRAEPHLSSLDEPPEPQTLQSVAKDRVRIQAKRRPPTRKSNRLADVSDDIGDDIFSGVGSVISDVPPAASSNTLLKVSDHSRVSDRSNDKSEASNNSTAIKRVQLPIADEVDPVRVAKETAPVTKATASVTKDPVTMTKKIASVLSDDIFDTGVQKQTNGAVKPSRTVDLFEDEANDLFADSSLLSKGSASKSTTANTSSSDAPSNLSADGSSAFTNSKQQPANSAALAVKSESKTAPAIKKPIIVDDEDIFADSLLTTTKKSNKVEDADVSSSKSGTKTSKVKPLAGVFDDDDDDIFSVKSKPSSAKQITTTKGFADDADDDLFESSSQRTATRQTTSTTRKKYTTKDEDLFTDDTDIFADVTMTSRSKVTTQSTKTQPKGLAESDDIFADIIAQPSASSTKSAKVAVKKATDADDIFDDPLNAFTV